MASAPPLPSVAGVIRVSHSLDAISGIKRTPAGSAVLTSGGAGVVEIPRLQELLRFICERGFEHHTAANFSSVAAQVHEATTRYLGWDMHWHKA